MKIIQKAKNGATRTKTKTGVNSGLRNDSESFWKWAHSCFFFFVAVHGNFMVLLSLFQSALLSCCVPVIISVAPWTLSFSKSIFS